MFWIQNYLVGWIALYWENWKKKEKVSESSAGLGMNVSPITSAEVYRNVLLNCCSVYCFPVWVLVICSKLFWLLSFRQIKAKWFYLMFYFLCFWPDIHGYDTFYVLGAFTYTLSSITFASQFISSKSIGGFLLQLDTETQKAIVLQREADPALPVLMSSVPYWHVCKGKDILIYFFQKPGFFETLGLYCLWLAEFYSFYSFPNTTLPCTLPLFHLLWENSEWPFNTQALRASSGTHRGKVSSYSFRLHSVCPL